MATLTGQPINTTYEGLLKLEDNAYLDLTDKYVTDGQGNQTNMQLAVAKTAFPSGIVDFTGATVNGLPAGPQGAQGYQGATGAQGPQGAQGSGGLVNGTGTESLKQADSLTPSNPAIASGAYAVAIGPQSGAQGSYSLCIGGYDSSDPQKATGLRTIRIGTGQTARAQDSVVIGSFCNDQSTANTASLIFGAGSVSFATRAHLFGTDENTFGARDINIGYRGNTEGPDAVGIGTRVYNGLKAASNGVAIGNQARATVNTATGHITIGNGATSSAADSIAIGSGAQSNAIGAIALGAVTAATADWTTTKNLQLTNYAALDFADDTAAAAGGVPLGGLYHTSGAAKIRIV